jgi:hypothetical protein
MLLARYFLYVGGALLALLWIVGAELPKAPVAPIASASADLPSIRISSDRKWPAKVVFDTTAPTIVPTQAAASAAVAAVPVVTAQATPEVRAHEAYAQLAPELKKSGVKKPEPKLRQKHKVAKRYMNARPMMMAQQPQFGFGFFGSRIW